MENNKDPYGAKVLLLALLIPLTIFTGMALELKGAYRVLNLEVVIILGVLLISIWIKKLKSQGKVKAGVMKVLKVIFWLIVLSLVISAPLLFIADF